MNHQNAKELFEEHVKTDNLKMHCIEVSAIMRELAKEFGEDEEKWAVTGLLHDLDFDETKDDMEQHAKKTVEILKEKDYPDDVIHTVLSHNEENTDIKRENKFDYALSAADNISGLIYAYALMRNGFDGMEVKGLKKKMKDKTFAAAVRRDLIHDIEKTGMELSRFLEISIRAMQGISGEIGF